LVFVWYVFGLFPPPPPHIRIFHIRKKWKIVRNEWKNCEKCCLNFDAANLQNKKIRKRQTS
jgi:hypothetical protein